MNKLLFTLLLVVGTAAHAEDLCNKPEPPVPGARPSIAGLTADKILVILDEHMRKVRERDTWEKIQAVCIRSRKPYPKFGMTVSDVVNGSSWGAPITINVLTMGRHENAQFVYERGFLYFTDGKLTTIQD